MDADLQARLRRHAEELETAAPPVGADEARTAAADGAPTPPRRWSGWVMAAAAAAVLVVGLGLAAGTGSGGDDQVWPDHSGLADDLEVEVQPVGGDVVRGPVVATSEGALLAEISYDLDARAAVGVSHDGGRSWIEVDLPDPPDQSLERPPSVHVAGGVAVAVATSALADTWGLSDLHLWTSVDGTTWRGPLVVEEVARVSSFEQLDGRLAGAVVADGQVVVLRSGDDGGTWERILARDSASREHGLQLWQAADGTWLLAAPVEGEPWAQDLLRSADGGSTWSVQERCDLSSACEPVHTADGIAVRGSEASVDGGRTWHTVPDAGSFSSVVALPGGGWLGTLLATPGAGAGDLAWLVRSDDGVTWEVLLGQGHDGCAEFPRETDAPRYSVSEPVRTASGWLLAYACPGADGPGMLDLYVTDGRATAVAGLGLDLPAERFLGQPLPMGDDVVVPVLDDDHRVAGTVVVR